MLRYGIAQKGWRFITVVRKTMIESSPERQRPNPVLLEQGTHEAGVAPQGLRTGSAYGGNSNSTQAVLAAGQVCCNRHQQYLIKCKLVLVAGDHASDARDRNSRRAAVPVRFRLVRPLL